jgi:NOL1/NOP2/fmu family ribosome biogenesis protein
MENLHILNCHEVRSLMAVLQQQWGFEDGFEYVFLINKKSNIFVANRDFSRLDLNKLRINSVGLYFGEMKDKTLRLSIEGSQLIGPKATRNVLEVSEAEQMAWLKGNDLEKEGEGFVILKHNDNYLGCGRAKDGKILNYVPKTRRIDTSA